MINTMGRLLDAWHALLSGSLSYSGKSVMVFKEDAPIDFGSAAISEHYVLLRAEGESDQSNKRSFVNDTVVIVDIVTKHTININRSVVENIDGQITALALTAPFRTGLSAQAGMQILNVTRETSNYLAESNNTEKTYRKVSRYNSRILQTS